MADSGILSTRAGFDPLGAFGSADAPNIDLLTRIPVEAATVLHVGCGTGVLGAAFKRLNPKARVLGIEAEPERARIAASRLDEVLAADPETAELDFALPRGIDCLIYDDILGRVREPWKLIDRHLLDLSAEGTVLASLPNAEHWSFVARLLQGRWDYQDAGLLDRGYLRWFTRESIRRGFAEAGLACTEMFERVFDADMAAGFVGPLAPALLALGTDPADYGRRAMPLQYVVRASRRSAERLHVVSTMLAPVGGVSEVRVLDPMRLLATQPGVTSVLTNGREVPAFAPDSPRIFILHRPAMIGPEGFRAVEPLIARGFVVVTEFDDHPDYIPILQTPDMFNFQAAHAIQTTTQALADVLRRDNQEVAVFPNGIRMLPDICNYAQRSHMTLFFGCLNRELDWPPFMGALNAVAAAAGEQLRFAVVHDRGFFEALQTPHKAFHPTMEYGAYMKLLGSCELSFMPLLDTPFNRAKSDLKFIEAAACRTTALASPVVYESSVHDGVTGVLFRNPDELRGRLDGLVASIDASRAIADAARAWIAEHRMLGYQIRDRVTWYRKLWARRAELNTALLERLPQLAPFAAGYG